VRAATIAMLAVAAGLAGCSTPPSHTAVAPAPAAGPQSPAVSVPAVAAAKPRSCVSLTQIRETRVVDDRTIDFIMRDRQVLRNTLPNSCPGLGFERAFTYATSLSELCSVDIITVLQQGGGIRRGASCGLGAFVPYAPVAATR